MARMSERTCDPWSLNVPRSERNNTPARVCTMLVDALRRTRGMRAFPAADIRIQAR